MGFFDFFSKMGSEMEVKATLNKLLSECKTKEDVGKAQVQFLNYLNKEQENGKITEERKKEMLDDADVLFKRKLFEVSL